MCREYFMKIRSFDRNVCILFFPNRVCHIAVTASKPERFINVLRRRFATIGATVIAESIHPIGGVNHWGCIDGKYVFRYLMHFAGYEIVNQDGSFFTNIEVEARDWVKSKAREQYFFHLDRPFLSIARAELAKRRRKFLPLQVIRRAAIEQSAQLMYTPFERRLFHMEAQAEL